MRTAINQPAVFIQDNSPCHRAKSVKTFLSEEEVIVMECPAHSLDMNPIENVWKLLNETVKEKNPRNFEELIWKDNGRKYPLMNAWMLM